MLSHRRRLSVGSFYVMDLGKKKICIKQLACFFCRLPTRLLQLCQRTMALPVGRGMFTLFSYHPVPTEQLPIPKLNLTGTLVRVSLGCYPISFLNLL